MKKNGGVRRREDNCGGPHGLMVQICVGEIIFGGEKEIISSLASYLGILDDEFEELLSTGKIGKFWSW